ITDNMVVNINQGASGCQEGNGIEVRNMPFDTTGADLNVEIRNNTVMGYQKNGITANGSIFAIIDGNTIVGAGPVDYIAQNGIQVGFGGRAVVTRNAISGNDYTPRSFVACGLLYFDADGVRAHENLFSRNERQVCNFGRGDGNPF
ncbi:MAG: right-handed parallel beta-helix repeat-containing protein, partial [Acidobacteria bacterium]|nr:right-handed parallel beta-helix repeat-containing protein [Acidobacteriota bacterium]